MKKDGTYLNSQCALMFRAWKIVEPFHPGDWSQWIYQPLQGFGLSPYGMTKLGRGDELYNHIRAVALASLEDSPT